MSPKAKPIPDGFHTITPHIVVKDAAKAIEFYQKAFGAKDQGRMFGPDGKRIMHAKILIGNSLLMLVDEFPEWKCLGPLSIGGTSVGLHLYVEDADSVFQRAIAAGASVKMPIMDAFWGDRYGKLADPFGHEWAIATHIKDMTPEEMRIAGEKAMAEMQAQKK